jgi:hypothetical protein
MATAKPNAAALRKPRGKTKVTKQPSPNSALAEFKVNPKAKSWITHPNGELVNWHDPDQVRKSVAANFNEDWHKEVQPVDWVEARALTWLRELEQIGRDVLKPTDPDAEPNYDLAAKIRLALVKFSSVNRQRIDLNAQIAMQPPKDLSGLSDADLKAIELADNNQLNDLALRIQGMKSAKPDGEEPN